MSAYEVRRPKILPNDSMPKRLPGSSHPHRQRQQRKVRHPLRIARHQRLVSPNPGVMVDVARLRETDDGVDEDI